MKLSPELVVTLITQLTNTLETLAQVARQDPEVWSKIQGEYSKASKAFDEAVDAELASRGEAEK